LSAMKRDPYRSSAKKYDLFIEPLTRELRYIGKKFYPPEKGMHVLDVGCGTGNTLKIYLNEGCNVYGIDSSLAMLNEAKKKLSDQAELRLGIASKMEYSSESFDLVISMLSLHEMPKEIRPKVVAEMLRVSKEDGRVLLIDYHPDDIRFPRGWMYKALIYFFEIAAGREHFKNFRSFIRNKGIPGLIISHKLTLDKMKIAGGGNFGFYLLKRKNTI
jgi:ubiquinone/menaquinone biosynthesis C-methylase UbiE